MSALEVSIYEAYYSHFPFLEHGGGEISYEIFGITKIGSIISFELVTWGMAFGNIQ